MFEEKEGKREVSILIVGIVMIISGIFAASAGVAALGSAERVKENK